MDLVVICLRSYLYRKFYIGVNFHMIFSWTSFIGIGRLTILSTSCLGNIIFTLQVFQVLLVTLVLGGRLVVICSSSCLYRKFSIRREFSNNFVLNLFIGIGLRTILSTTCLGNILFSLVFMSVIINEVINLVVSLICNLYSLKILITSIDSFIYILYQMLSFSHLFRSNINPF